MAGFVKGRGIQSTEYRAKSASMKFCPAISVGNRKRMGEQNRVEWDGIKQKILKKIYDMNYE